MSGNAATPFGLKSMKKGDLVVYRPTVHGSRLLSPETVGMIVGRHQDSPGCPRSYLVLADGEIKKLHRYELRHASFS